MVLDPSIKLRQMLAGDIPTACELCRVAGWNQIADDWHFFISTQPKGCVVAAFEERIVATATAANYENKIGWIGMVLVNPEMRRRGIATALLGKCIDLLSNCQCIKLDATDAGRKVYQKLGFIDEYRIDRYVCNSLKKIPDEFNCQIKKLRQEDLKSVAQLDNKIFGASRKPLLQEFFTLNKQSALASFNANNKINGYALSRKGYNFTQIGPIVAADQQTGQMLLSESICRNSHAGPLCIDINEFQTDGAELLKSCDFELQRSFIRMYLGKNNICGQPAKQVAICGPEHG